MFSLFSLRISLCSVNFKKCVRLSVAHCNLLNAHQGTQRLTRMLHLCDEKLFTFEAVLNLWNRHVCINNYGLRSRPCRQDNSSFSLCYVLGSYLFQRQESAFIKPNAKVHVFLKPCFKISEVLGGWTLQHKVLSSSRMEVLHGPVSSRVVRSASPRIHFERGMAGIVAQVESSRQHGMAENRLKFVLLLTLLWNIFQADLKKHWDNLPLDYLCAFISK